MQPAPPLSARVKIGYGAGQLTEGVKTAAFTFVFFYYTQVLGVPAASAGIVLFVATVFDAITDPLMGSIADRSTFGWGRRHPFMYAAALPLAITFVAVFLPPSALGPTGLWWWLLIWAVGLRAAMTVFHVPYLALGAELTHDYAERSSIVAWRTAFGMGGMAVALAAAWGWFFRATEAFPNGQLNAAAYPGFGLAAALMVWTAATVAAISTHHRIALLPRADGGGSPGWRGMFTGWRAVLRNRSFRALFVGMLAFGTMRGAQETLSIHLYTYFWALAAPQILAVYLVGIVALIAALPAWTRVARRHDKKPVLLAGVAVFITPLALMPVLQIAGLFPAQGTWAFLPALLAGYGAAGIGAAAVFVASGSMFADVVDEVQAESGLSLAGVLFGASALSFKVTTGLGGWLSGMWLSAVAFPVEAAPGEVPVRTLMWLGVGYGPLAAVLGGLAIACFLPYAITRARHGEIRARLDGPAA